MMASLPGVLLCLVFAFDGAVASASPVGDYISNWVKSQEGKRVGSNATHHKQTECWDLAMAAIEHAKQAGFNIPRAPSSYVWSTQTVSYEQAQPGDIVQFVSWKEKVIYPGGGWSTKSTGPHHTAVMTSSWDAKACGLQVEEQNPKPVAQGVYHPCDKEHISGSMVIYRLSSSSPTPPSPPSPSPPPSGCHDNPQNWKSSEGDSCSVYVSYQYCTPDGREGPGWRHQQWGPITNYADSHGRSALDACCGCGGGSRRVVVV